LSGAYAHAALRDLGWLPQAGKKFSSSQLVRQLGIVPEQRPLFDRLLEFLLEDGLLQALRPPARSLPAGDQAKGDQATGDQATGGQATDANWQLARKIDSPPDPELIGSQLGSQYAECDAELMLLG